MRSFVLAAVSLFIPGLALAGGKVLPADQHSPALYADQGAAWINVVGNNENYHVKSSFRVFGAGGANDRMRMEWKAGGRVIDSAKCQSEFAAKAKLLTGICDMDKGYTQTGAVDADLIYIDDSNDTEYLVTTYHVTVKKWKGPGKSWNWGITPDDLLAVAFVRHWHGQPFHNVPLIEFWSTSNELMGDATFRCAVDGQKLPDFKAHVDQAHGSGYGEIQVDVTTDKDRWSYLYRHVDIDPGFHFGSKNDHGIYNADAMSWAEDHPGKWDCMLRSKGHQVRQFTFVVNAKGMVEPSAMQSGAHPLKTLDNVVLIDMKIPAENGVEKRIRPDAMRKSIGFGTAWPDGATVEDAKKAFPPASGTPD